MVVIAVMHRYHSWRTLGCLLPLKVSMALSGTMKASPQVRTGQLRDFWALCQNANEDLPSISEGKPKAIAKIYNVLECLG